MKIIQVPFCYYPDPAGGTEAYLQSMVRELSPLKIQSVVVAPGTKSQSYAIEEIPVRRYAVQANLPLPDLYGEGDPAAAMAFGVILDEEKPDILHLHAFTAGVSLRMVREAKKRKIPVLFTYHTPTVSCTRGTLLRWGNEICDGQLSLDLCTRCTLHGHGLPRGLADLAGKFPRQAGEQISRTGISGGIATALQMRYLIQMRHTAIRQLWEEVDHIVAVCDWVKQLLLNNGISEKKITLSRQGVDSRFRGNDNNEEIRNKNRTDPTIRLVFLGRVDPTKGLHILLKALASDRTMSVTLDLYGVTQCGDGQRYFKQLKSIVGKDTRVQFRDPVPSGQVVELLRNYDFLIVPSQWLETGPLVVLEAFAAGIPVIGSRLGGISELVRHQENGLLVEAGSVHAWQNTLREICQNRELIEQLKPGISMPRTMRQVALEMQRLYNQVCNAPN